MDGEEAKKKILAGKTRGPIQVEGVLDLSVTSITKLPKGLSCFELNLSQTPIKELPDDLSVESTINVQGCSELIRLPEGLTVGTLNAQGCESLAALPEGLDVWFLNVRGCQLLETLPKRAVIRGGSLRIGGCHRIATLPSYLTELATLDVSDCPSINSLPKKLRVSLWIDVGGSGIKSLGPPHEHVGIRWRSVAINHRIAFRPETITAKEALAEKNAELRRVLIERMGSDRFMKQANPTILDHDRDSGGERKLLHLPLENDEPMVCLSCFCPSTTRHYLLRVPPDMKTCRQAAAWMAGFDDPDKYQPVMET